MPDETDPDAPRPPATAMVTADDDPEWTSVGFSHTQRVANMYAASTLIPKHLRGKLPDVAIALLMARRLNEDPLVVMQAIHIISDKAGWSAQYMIARANRSGVFHGRINWRVERRPERLKFKRKTKTGWNERDRCAIYREDDVTMPDWTITAYAKLADTGEEVSFAVDSQMAIDEGWANNEKYSSIGELMLRYRSAAFLIRLYAGDVMLGIPIAEEIEEPSETVTATTAAAPTGRAALGIAEVAAPAPTPAPAAKPVVVEAKSEPVKPPEVKPAPKPEPAKAPEPPPKPAAPPIVEREPGDEDDDDGVI